MEEVCIKKLMLNENEAIYLTKAIEKIFIAKNRKQILENSEPIC